jgi:uncharacterized protein YjaG (DUF416 family)
MAFDRAETARVLSTLPFWHRLAFAASCCERMLPNYVAFHRMERWGDPAPLEQGLDYLWRCTLTHDPNPLVVHRLIAACEAVVPDTEDFESVFCSLALDAANSVILGLEACGGDDVARAVEIAESSVNGIIRYLERVNDPVAVPHLVMDQSTYTYVLASPLLRAELDKQRRDLAALAACQRLDAHVIDQMRAESRETGIQPIRRGLVSLGR